MKKILPLILLGVLCSSAALAGVNNPSAGWQWVGTNIWFGGWVGIGTNPPSAPLDVAGENGAGMSALFSGGISVGDQVVAGSQFQTASGGFVADDDQVTMSAAIANILNSYGNGAMYITSGGAANDGVLHFGINSAGTVATSTNFFWAGDSNVLSMTKNQALWANMDYNAIPYWRMTYTNNTAGQNVWALYEGSALKAAVDARGRFLSANSYQIDNGSLLQGNAVQLVNATGVTLGAITAGCDAGFHAGAGGNAHFGATYTGGFAASTNFFYAGSATPVGVWDDTGFALGTNIPSTASVAYRLHVHVQNPTANQKLQGWTKGNGTELAYIDEDGDYWALNNITAGNNVTAAGIIASDTTPRMTMTDSTPGHDDFRFETDDDDSAWQQRWNDTTWVNRYVIAGDGPGAITFYATNGTTELLSLYTNGASPIIDIGLTGYVSGDGDAEGMQIDAAGDIIGSRDVEASRYLSAPDARLVGGTPTILWEESVGTWFRESVDNDDYWIDMCPSQDGLTWYNRMVIAGDGPGAITFYATNGTTELLSLYTNGATPIIDIGLTTWISGDGDLEGLQIEADGDLAASRRVTSYAAGADFCSMRNGVFVITDETPSIQMVSRTATEDDWFVIADDDNLTFRQWWNDAINVNRYVITGDGPGAHTFYATNGSTVLCRMYTNSTTPVVEIDANSYLSFASDRNERIWGDGGALKLTANNSGTSFDIYGAYMSRGDLLFDHSISDTDPGFAHGTYTTTGFSPLNSTNHMIGAGVSIAEFAKDPGGGSRWYIKPQSAAPTIPAPRVGDIYCDSDDGFIYAYNGAGWDKLNN